MSKQLGVVIATPTYDNKVISGYVAGVTSAMMLMRDRGWKPNLVFVSGTFLEIARSECAEMFYSDTDADYLVFVDADMGFTGQDVVRLVDKAVETDAGVLAAPGPRRNVYPIQFPVTPPAGERTFTRNKHGICRVERVGTAFMAIHRRVIAALREKVNVMTSNNGQKIPLLFEMMWRDDGAGGKELLPEDYAFCKRAADAGFPPYVMEGVVLLHAGEFDFVGAWSADYETK